MAIVETRVIGVNGVRKALARLPDQIRRPVEKAVFVAAQGVRTAVLDSMKGPKTGKVYRVPDTKTRRYTASAPGDAPAIPTGRLFGSIKVVREPDRLAARIGLEGGEAVKYAPMLEFGTTRMAARPFLIPALESQRDTFERKIQEAVRQAERQAGRQGRGAS